MQMMDGKFGQDHVTETAMTATPRTVYKVVSAEQWTTACRIGSFEGSADDRRDGFIHLSDAAQLNGTLEKHFMGQSDLLLVAFEATSLGASLHWEPSRGGALFPHLFAPLPASLALWQRSLYLNTNGVPHVDPAWLAC